MHKSEGEMAYVEEFRSCIAARDYSKIMQLWHEYCQGDLIDAQEIINILQLLKQSDFAKPFGQYVEAILPLALMIEDEKCKLDALRLIIDLETTHSEALYHVTLDLLQALFGTASGFSDKIRLVGMRTRENFQGAISNFLLLNHIQKGNFVLHTAGWGIGEIIDFSMLREQASIEFENLQGGKRDISFKNAFKTLLPVSNEHFLVRRFTDPEKLEAYTKEHPVEVVRSILSDLGPKTASEIKDLLVDIVILEEDYSKWWQQARSKLKKDPLIESPENPKHAFQLRKGVASIEDRVTKAFQGKRSFQDILQAANSLIRDFPEVLREPQVKEQIVAKIKNLLLAQNLPPGELLQGLLFLEQALQVTEQQDVLKNLVLELTNIEALCRQIEIISLKKRLLVAIQNVRSDWVEIFLKLLFVIEPNQLKDFLLKELGQPLGQPKSQELVHKQLVDLINHPKKYPEAFFWYFQKVINNEESLFQDAKMRGLSFESLLVLLSSVEFKPETKDLAKKIYTLLTNNRFELVRAFFKETSVQFVKEFLLLASKCQTFSDHEQKILRSLAEVAHPELAKGVKNSALIDTHVLWTTQEGYSRVHERIKQIGTVEMVANAKEVEVARAHGDLRENAEYKAACERRSRLQSELKLLSEQFRHARIITKDDVHTDCVSIGVQVELLNQKGEKSRVLILGPWDTNPEASILSFQSKLVQSMLGKKIGETFAFKEDEYTVVSLTSYFDL